MEHLDKTDDSLLLHVVFFLLISDVPSLIALIVHRYMPLDDDQESHLNTACFYCFLNISKINVDNHGREESDRQGIYVDLRVDSWHWFLLMTPDVIDASLERETRCSRVREADR